MKLFNTIFLLLSFSTIVNAQLKDNNDSENSKTSGVSVSPAHHHLTMSPGDVKTFSITIKNYTENEQKFNVKPHDFEMKNNGKTKFLPAGKGEYSLSKWMNISPTFIQLKPGETKDINLTVSIPTDSSGYRSAWNLLSIEQVKERKTLNASNNGGKTIGFGVIPTFAFGVYIYQNPPNVKNTSVEIINFSKNVDQDLNTISIEAKNTGTGIAYATAYIDLTNTTNGKQQRIKVKKFTIIPELTRIFKFNLPENLEKGKYLAIGVLDYDGSKEIQAAKMKFEIN